MSGYPETVYVVHVTAPFFGRAWEERPTGYSVRYDMHDEDAADRFATLEATIALLIAERDQARAEAAAAYEVLTLTKRAGDLREVYHSLPNEHNRIGDKRSRKGHARDAWLRAFRKADREARAILSRLDQRKEEGE